MSSHNSIILASRVCDDHAVTLAFIFFRHFINWLPLCVLKLKTFHPASGSGFPLDRTCNEWNGEMCVRTLCSRKNGKHWLLDSSSGWEREQVEWTKQIDRSEMFPSTRLKSCVSVVEPESDFIHKKIICRSERSSPSSLRAVSRRLLSISRFVRVIRKLLCSSDMRDFFFWINIPIHMMISFKKKRNKAFTLTWESRECFELTLTTTSISPLNSYTKTKEKRRLCGLSVSPLLQLERNLFFFFPSLWVVLCLLSIEVNK